MRTTPELSEEILVDILSRLPVKLLFQLRCVSKPWRSLLTDPDFAIAHLNRALSRNFLLASHTLYSVNHEASFDTHVVASDLDFPLKHSFDRDGWVWIFGSCNGLFCIMPAPGTFFIFNPSTRESKKIPDAQIDLPVHDGVNYAYGFGHAKPINDYKFLKFISGSALNVYSLKSNSWKRVGNFDYENPHNEAGTPLRDAVHWVVTRRGGQRVIGAFDLVEERFKELSPPDPIKDSRNRFTTGVLGDSLCVMHNYDLRCREFWIMKQYGVKESWTRILIRHPYHTLMPLCFWKNSKFLLAVDGKKLVLLNPKDGTCKDFEVDRMPVEFDALMYVESMISPNQFQQ